MKCAHCGAEMRPDQAREIIIEQGTAVALPIFIHDQPADCTPTIPVRRHN